MQFVSKDDFGEMCILCKFIKLFFTLFYDLICSGAFVLPEQVCISWI